MITHSQPWIGKREVDAVSDILRSGMLIGGEARGKFSHALNRLVGGDKEVALFASGRMAIQAALTTLGLPSGSNIIVQSYVCDAVLWAIREAGHFPVLCDIADGWVANVEQMEAVFTDCGAIILAPPFGFRQSAAAFRQFGVPIIHDLCQASPKILVDASPETIGDIVSLSFHPTKYLCAGGGGAAIDMTGQYGENLKALESACHESAPFTDMQAAIGSVQITRIDELEMQRARIFDLYIAEAPKALVSRLLKQIDVSPGHMFRFPLDLNDCEAKDLFPELAKAGIIMRHGVDQLAHHRLGFDDAKFPNTMRAFRKTLSPPFYPALGDTDARTVAGAFAGMR